MSNGLSDKDHKAGLVMLLIANYLYVRDRSKLVAQAPELGSYIPEKLENVTHENVVKSYVSQDITDLAYEVLKCLEKKQ